VTIFHAHDIAQPRQPRVEHPASIVLVQL
jgi:hypothetical protein